MRLFRAEIENTGNGVSIHASVKDATPHNLARLIGFFVSIHASVKDATYFKPRISIILFVSIHASVKDATMYISLPGTMS